MADLDSRLIRVAGTIRTANRIRPPALALDRVRRHGELPVVLCIDVEPDGRAIDRDDPGGWAGFEELLRVMPPMCERLGHATGTAAAFTWGLRMDPQVDQTWGTPAWVVEEWGDQLAMLEREGHELGLHTHDWRWHDEMGTWVAINEDPAWEVYVVEMAIEAFRQTLGRPAAAHRGGAHMLTPAMLEPLERGGVQVDLTVEAGLAPQAAMFEGEHFIGRNADYRVVPSKPYRTSAATFPAPDPAARSGPLLMPLSGAPTRRGGRAPLSIWSAPGAFATRLALGMLRSSPPVLAFVIRSDVVLKPQWESVVANLQHLAGHRGVRFVTASTAAAAFTAA